MFAKKETHGQVLFEQDFGERLFLSLCWECRDRVLGSEHYFILFFEKKTKICFFFIFVEILVEILGEKWGDERASCFKVVSSERLDTPLSELQLLRSLPRWLLVERIESMKSPMADKGTKLMGSMGLHLLTHPRAPFLAQIQFYMSKTYEFIQSHNKYNITWGIYFKWSMNKMLCEKKEKKFTFVPLIL